MLNLAQIIGRTGKDPEVRYLPSGEAVVNISLATSEKWKDKQSGEAREETEWHRISAFGKLAEIIGQYVKKGDLIYIAGKIKTRKYQDKDGSERYATEIRASEMKMLGSKGDGGERQAAPERQQRPAAQQQPQGSGFDDMDDDIPF